MKNILTLILFSLFFFVSQSQAQDWTKKAITGEGDVVKRTLEVDNFDGIVLGFHGDVYLTQGSSQKVEVEAQANIIENINTEVKNGVWHVNNKRNVRNTKKVKVYVTMTDLSKAAISGSGNLVMTNTFRNLDDVKLSISGSGDLEASIEAGDVSSHISGSGRILVKGSAKSNDMHISGSGDINARDLEVETCEIHISGSGDCSVFVNQSIDAHVSGSGDIDYKGSPNIKSRISGSGDIRKM